jgi:DNA-binding FrmR family transcriptional regulator
VTSEAKKDALLALKTARGQLDGIVRMLEDDRYCIDISKQILSAQSLLKKANLKVLRGHIKSCVADAIKKGEAEEKIEEIFGIIDKYTRPV